MNGPFYGEGNYIGQVTQQAMTKASTGTPQFVLRFKVLSGLDGTLLSHQYERTIYRSITEKTMEYVRQDLEALGFNGDSLRQLDPANGPDFHDFSGQQIEVYCKHEDGNDGPREKWGLSRQSSKPIDGEPVEASTYRHLDALFGASKGGGVRASTPVRQVASPTAVQRANPFKSDEITDEDIPF